ncbi:MAG: bifunctional folylpolyglutamate synthase/dihydrofolate synthase [Nitrospirae bacterium]|nr:bifunctional folylpolyglutamate synthase/dihydrofolate synthase [Nitrospirota bacterium]
MSYKDAISYLYDLQWHGIKLELSNITRVMGLLGNPQSDFKTIHVGGTNGKGSTASIIASILSSSGYRVGLYTSPHLIDFRERIKVDGVDIGEKDVDELTRKIRGLAEKAELKPTFFEFTTAMAFCYFSRMKVDLAVIEVGMGGRLDATNVIDPVVSVITNVDLDHQEYLGPAIKDIAFEKAGIIKKGVPLVSAADNKEALSVISDRCREAGAMLYLYGREFYSSGDYPDNFTYYGIRRRHPSLASPLLGSHQMINSSCALAVIELLAEKGMDITDDNIREGLRSARWDGRLEVIQNEPLFILDGAHNRSGAAALARYLMSIKNGKRRLILIVGVMKDKDIGSILDQLIPVSNEVIITKADYHRSAGAELVKSFIKSGSIPIRMEERIKDAIALARSIAGPDDIICVTGSLFVVGEAKACLSNIGPPSGIKG